MRGGYLAASLVAIAAGAASPAAAGPAVHSCGRFIVGEANSTAYADGKLPAKGTARGDSCATLKRIARRLSDGTYSVPPGRVYHGVPPAFGKPFPVYDVRQWSCRLQNRGGSGPSYAVRCQRRRASLTWEAG